MFSSDSEENQVQKRISLQTNTDPGAATQLLSWFEQLNQPPIADQNAWWQCQTALKEGFDNVVNYAHQGLPQETPILIEAIRWPHSIEIRIWDQGLPFDLERQLQVMPNLEDNEGEHGRGLKIMKKIADYLSYQRLPDQRNCLVIIKRF